MDLKRLHEILKETTIPLRKGPEVTTYPGAISIQAMPHFSEVVKPEVVQVDCHFIMVGVNKAAAEALQEEIVNLLWDYPQPERLSAGPSYIEVGGEIGSQEGCLRLYALGQVLGLWTVITPATLGITGPEADNMAGMGMVMISGFKG